jgi:DNA-binding LacI/PurR family transcriptional regulator
LKQIEMTITIHELAKEIGVSSTTISAALTGNGRISERTRQRVLKAANERGFSPNPHARRLSWQGSNDTICLLGMGLDTGVGTRKVLQMQRYLVLRGFNTPIHSLDWISEEKGLVDDVRLTREICLLKPRAIICFSNHLSARSLDVLEQHQKEGGIVVCYDRDTPQFDNVVFDSQQNTYLAVAHLAELGHRSILFAYPVNFEGWKRESRYLGYRQALRKYGIRMQPEWLVPCQRFAEARGVELANAYLAMKEKPTAACIVNDNAAAAFIGEIQLRGFRVPRDISVVGHDDEPIAPYTNVPLTTVSNPVDEIVHEVLQLLNDRLSNTAPLAPRRRIVRGKLVVRQSSAPPPDA